MNNALTEEQRLFATTVKDMLVRRYTTEYRHALTASELGWSREMWAAFAEVGLLALTIDEEHGGLGAGPAAAAAAMTEIGRSLALEPLTDAVLVPTQLVADTGSAAQCAEILRAVADGTVLLAFAHLEPGGSWSCPAVGTKAERDGDRYLLTGTKNVVFRGDCADRLIVSAVTSEDGDRLGLFLVDATADGLSRNAYTTYDGLRGAELTLARTPGERLGDADASEAVRRAVISGQLAVCAEAVGIMDEALRLTVEYLKTRKQFGVPLASFQALAHRAADLYVTVEMARGMCDYATAKFADGDADEILASRVKLQIGRSARRIGQEAIQMHGGIGMTAEHAIGQYVRRLLAIEHTFGSSDEHLRRLANRVRDHDLIEL
ncbi:acyl-CoA dehydrogenase family protein [Rhodococcus sp. MSC1_016]|jgi:alkylation response protein AidB-like acyl-CoA dehydrogenase|uniref:acyl-CoA dehydrogenase family protein n=1 Tax=Rhodococcus sp. MSC1_016 TaxID=2909266 RepID=UPI00202E5C0B|nr:acyl-CoA dehydrogenase family protein [Rhodococcus sp. MSC1_016]